MTDIENESRRRLNEAYGGSPVYQGAQTREDHPEVEAMCRLLEEFEAYKREVSDAVELHQANMYLKDMALERFILPKPVDPLVEVMQAWWDADGYNDTAVLRKIMDERGYEIREKAGE